VRNFYEDSSATSQPRNDSSPTNISNVTTPKGTDLHVNTKLNYDLLSDLWLFPSDATINFSKSNKMCPENCIQQFEDVSFNTSPPASPDEFYIYGVDKIRDTKSTSSDVVAWKYYKMVGWSLVKTGIEENMKNGETTYSFDGILTFGVR
jgi:hypothetical protein